MTQQVIDSSVEFLWSIFLYPLSIVILSFLIYRVFNKPQ